MGTYTFAKSVRPHVLFLLHHRTQEHQHRQVSRVIHVEEPLAEFPGTRRFLPVVEAKHDHTGDDDSSPGSQCPKQRLAHGISGHVVGKEVDASKDHKSDPIGPGRLFLIASAPVKKQGKDCRKKRPVPEQGAGRKTDDRHSPFCRPSDILLGTEDQKAKKIR